MLLASVSVVLGAWGGSPDAIFSRLGKRSKPSLFDRSVDVFSLETQTIMEPAVLELRSFAFEYLRVLFRQFGCRGPFASPGVLCVL